MEKPHRRKKTSAGETLLDDVFQASSATDCTGLISSMPTSRDELENYSDVYSYLPETKAFGEGDNTTKTPDKQQKKDDLKKALDEKEHDRLY